MRRSLAIGGLVTVLLSAACSASRDPGPGTAPKPGAAGPSAGVARSKQPVPVAEPWHKGMPEYGVNVYWDNSPKDNDEVVRAKAERILDYVVGLKANSVTFSFPIYTTGITSNTLRAGTSTPSPKRIAVAVEEAVRRGLRTSVRPLLSENVLIEQNPKAWRGTIAPASRTGWFDNYRKLLLPYAESARGAETFVVATELNSLEGDTRWKKVVSEIKGVFPGEVAYSANFDSYQKGHVGVPADVVGVDAYPKFSLDDSASVSTIASAWSRWLHKYAIDGPPILYEAGIAAQDGAYRNPGHWGSQSRKLNLELQQRWYEAICDAMHDGAAAGVYWWKVDFDTDPATADVDSPDRLTFVGRPAEDTIRDCFSTS